MRLQWMGEHVRVDTPAKLNLYLRIRGRRDDGFHELETLMVSVGLWDTLTLSGSTANELNLICRSTIPQSSPIPTDDSNLIIKAARLLQEVSGCTKGAAIHLTKRIPSEAGMGGGSSDAAATLVALNQVWKLELTSDELHQLAAQLGSDVNFFLDSHPAAICTGRGEKITPIPLRGSLNFVVIKPPSGLSTGKVFQKWQEHKDDTAPDLENLPRRLTEGQMNITDSCYNSLEAPAQILNADVQQCLDVLSKTAHTRGLMSGSGTSCFCVCRSWRHAQVVSSQIESFGFGQVFALQSDC